MRWLKSPAPSRRAPARSAVIGISIRRASSVPARIATARPSAIKSATRINWSRIGASACAVGCSKNTCQPSFGTALGRAHHRMTLGIAAQRQRLDGSGDHGGDLRQLREILADVGSVGGSCQHLAAGIHHIGEGGLADLGVAKEVRQEAQVDIGHGDAGIEAGLRHRDRHHGPLVPEIGRREADAVGDGFGEAHVAGEISEPAGRHRDAGQPQASRGRYRQATTAG